MDANLLQLISNSTGEGQGSRGQTIETFLASLVTGAILFVVQIGLFLHYRKKKEYREFYQRRTNIARPPETALRLIATLWYVKDEEVQRQCGLDGYFFLRYLKMLLQIFGGALPLLLSVLLPLNLMDGKGTSPVPGATDGRRWNVTGLDQLAWGNIRPQNANRYWAHFSMAVVTVAWICFNFALECRHYVAVRHRMAWAAPSMPSPPVSIGVETGGSDLSDLSVPVGSEARLTGSAVRATDYKTSSTAGLESPSSHTSLSATSRPRSIRPLSSTVTGPARASESLTPSSNARNPVPDQSHLGALTVSWWLLYIREAVWHGAMMATLIAGAILAVISGILSQLSYFPLFHSWPSWIVSALQGIAPALCIAVIMAVLPWMFRWLCNLQVLRRGSSVELLLQQYNFAFLFFQLFLVASLTCSLATFLNSATNIGSWPTLLAENVPKSSNYFMSYMVLQGLSISAKELAKVPQLASDRLRAYYSNWRQRGSGTGLGHTGSDGTRASPSESGRCEEETDIRRDKHSSALTVLTNGRAGNWTESEQNPTRGKEARAGESNSADKPERDASENEASAGVNEGEQIQWGSYFPLYTTIACIGFIYCIIAPLITVFNVLTFGLFLLVYRYNSLWIVGRDSDSKGRLFPRAIHQLFVGIYVMEICLAGMFFMIADDRGKAACIGQGVGMLLVLGLTVSYQVFLTKMLDILSGEEGQDILVDAKPMQNH